MHRGYGRYHRGHHSPLPIVPLVYPIVPLVYPIVPLVYPIVPIVPLPLIPPLLPIVPYPAIIPGPYPIVIPPVDSEKDINLRFLSGNLYIVTTPYLRNSVFTKDESGSFHIVGFSPSGSSSDIKFYTSDEISKMSITVV